LFFAASTQVNVTSERHATRFQCVTIAASAARAARIYCSNTIMSDPQPSVTTPTPAFDWRWKAFDDLTHAEVYDMLEARSTVFVIEQTCLYGDIDGLDRDAWHLLAYGSDAPRATLAG
jgi:hypothetical protein